MSSLKLKFGLSKIVVIDYCHVNCTLFLIINKRFQGGVVCELLFGTRFCYNYIIIGSKSQSRPNDPPIMKEQKIAQPASRRVRDAAEGLLSSLMEQVDFYTVYCGAESLSSTIDEIAFVYLASGEMLTMLQAAQNFRYFVLDNNVLLGIYEDVSQMGYEQQAKVSGMEMKMIYFITKGDYFCVLYLIIYVCCLHILQ